MTSQPSQWTAPLRRPRSVLRYASSAIRAGLGPSGFVRWSARWARHGGDLRWALHPDTWLLLHAEARRLPEGARALELGSGLGGLLLAATGLHVTSVDHGQRDLGRLMAAGRSVGDRLEPVHAPIVELAPGVAGYDFSVVPHHPYALVFVDGPPGDIGRAGLLYALDLARGATAIVLDDTEREQERLLAGEIASALGRRCRFGRSAAVIF